MFFKYFASKNQLPGLPIIGTLVENELIYSNLKSALFTLLTAHVIYKVIINIMCLAFCAREL